MIDTLEINDCWNKIGVWSNAGKRCEKLDDVIHCYNCSVYSSAGRSLLNRELPDGYGDEWADILASEKKSKSKNLQSVVVFRLGTEWMSLPVSIINEITLLRNIYDIPHNRNKKIRGMVNIRGELVICMSLGNLLGVDKPDDDFSGNEHSINRLITIRDANGYIVFPVSEIDGIFHYEKDELATAPDTIRNSTKNLIKGVIIVNDRNIGCIDHSALLSEISGNLR